MTSFNSAVTNRNIPIANETIAEVKQKLCQTIMLCITKTTRYPSGFFQSNGTLQSKLKRKKPGQFLLKSMNENKTQIITTWERAVQTHHSLNRWRNKQKRLALISASWTLVEELQQIRMLWFGSLIQPIDLCLRTIASIRYAPTLKIYTFTGLKSFHVKHSQLILTRMDGRLEIRVKFNQVFDFPNNKWIYCEADEHWR